MNQVSVGGNMAGGSYTPRHAAILSGGVVLGGVVWISYCCWLGLPFHPWLTIALVIVFDVSLFFYSGLDPFAVKSLDSLFRVGELLILLCVFLAVVFGPAGMPFPNWALIPLVAFGVLAEIALLFFGIREICRQISRRTGNGKCLSQMATESDDGAISVTE